MTKTVTKTRKEPCTETINYPTTVTQDIPRTNVFDVTDTVAVTTQGSRTDTIERDVAVRRIEDAPTSSIEAVRTDSSRVRDNFVPVQSVVKEDYEDLTFTPSEVEVTRQNLRYKDVEKTVSYDASFEGTEVKIQEVPRQKRVLQLQTEPVVVHDVVAPVTTVTTLGGLGRFGGVVSTGGVYGRGYSAAHKW